MCGIVGIRAKNKQGYVNFDNLEAAVDTLKHRGPDAQSCKFYTNVAFGHARLAIIDLDEKSNQPFENERYSLVFNGEIYNYKELRKNLLSKGIVFHTKSDTEVLFQLLVEYREKAIELLNGFFAFAFYDRLDDYFLVARDRMGIKPLFIYEDDSQFLFASELKTLLAFELDKSLDNQAISSYFRLTYFPKDRTIFKKIRKLLPGHYLELVGEKESKQKQYFNPIEVEKFEGTYEYALFELRNRMLHSVRSRLVADVPVGAFLSGGIDSTIIAALAKYNHHNLNTFSIGFDHPFFDESEYARIAADKIKSNHHEIRLDKSSFRQNFEGFLSSLDEPFGDSSAFAMYLLSKYAKEKVSVCLSGDGADELFGGYRKHFADWYIRSISSGKKRLIKVIGSVMSPFESSRSSSLGDKNRKIQKLKEGMEMSPSRRYYEWCSFISEVENSKLLKQKLTVGYDDFCEYSELTDFSNFNNVLLSDQLMLLPNDMLKKVDLMSMASALEVRTPFLDHHVVTFANSLPEAFKVWEQGGKRILKDAFKTELPEEIIHRSKKGFEIPIKDWLGDLMQELLETEMFSQDFIEHQNIFNWKFIRQIKANGMNNQDPNFIYLIWSLLAFQFWYKKHLG